MSTKIEYICDGCGFKGPTTQSWIEITTTMSTSGLFKTYHSCRNFICLRKVQQKQCSDVADSIKIHKINN